MYEPFLMCNKGFVKNVYLINKNIYERVKKNILKQHKTAHLRQNKKI